MSLSKFTVWEPPFYNLRGREVQFVNAIHTTHDLFCGCDSPSLHVLACMFFPSGVQDDSVLQQAVKRLQGAPQNNPHNNLPCLTGGEDLAGTNQGTTDPDILEGLEPGDLDALFADDVDAESTSAG